MLKLENSTAPGVPVIGDKTWRSYQDFYIDIRYISKHESESCKNLEMLSQLKLMSHVREACMK